jgi:quercetin dioxygenase-like cupin family protein
MTNRSQHLQHLIHAIEAGVRARTTAFPDAIAMTDRIFSALENVGNGGGGGSTTPRPPVCNHLDDAFDEARDGPRPIPDLCDAFAAIEPELSWSPKPGSENVAGEFYDNHANAVIIGVGGLETRRDVRIGVSLVAPGIHYPRHHHPPEEIYIVLSPGEWMQNDNPFVPKQSGDLVHNPPNVWHGMQAGPTAPLLAIWSLWTGG